MDVDAGVAGSGSGEGLRTYYITKIEELPDDQAVLKCPSPVGSATHSRSLSQDSIAADEGGIAEMAVVVPKEESTPESEMAAAESRLVAISNNIRQ